MKGAKILTKQEYKKEKKIIKNYEKKNVKHNTTDLIPISHYENNCYKLKNGTYIDFVKIICHDLISASCDYVNEINYMFDLFYKTFGDDFKIIASNYPVDTQSQQEFYRYKISKTNNTVFRKLLTDRLAEEEYIEKHFTDREYYLMLFFKSPEEKNECIASIKHNLGEHFLVDELTEEKKERILFKLCNKNLTIDTHENIRKPNPEAIKRYINELGYDPYLLSRIQPQGGITFKNEKYIKTGTGYEACLHIFKYTRHPGEHWLSPLMNINNVIAIMDVSTENSETAKRNLNKSMVEQESRIESAKSYSELLSSRRQLAEFKEIYTQIDQLDEVVKLIHIRLFITASTTEEIDKIVAAQMKRFSGKGYKAAVFLDETKAEWMSMFQTYTEQDKNEYRRFGQAVTANQLARGNPFDYSSLNDVWGTYMGLTTSCNGIVNFNPFQSDDYRTSYCGVIAGQSGKGKSTCTKKILEIQAALGNYLRYFDVKNEYIDLTESLGGVICYLDGSKGRINILDILKIGDNDSISFTRHLSKLRSIYKFLSPSATNKEETTFENVLCELYEEWKLTPDTAIQITGLSAKKYPVLSDLLSLVNNKIEKLKKTKNAMEQNVALMDIEELKNIQLTLTSVVRNYGYIFDGHTNIENIYDEQIVCFNITELAKMSPNIFRAQIFNAISICWDNCNKHGAKMKQLYENNAINAKDIQYFLTILDEAHRIVNPSNLSAVEQLTLFEREGRYLFSGLLLVSQRISDFIPEGTSNDAVAAIKALFEMTAYKFIFGHDSNSLNAIKTIFGSELTQSQIDKIPNLRRGNCILVLSGDKTIEMKIDVSETELKLFSGGV